jgi:uncharacterized phage-associated protein
MASVRDAAQFILDLCGPMTAMKLQKLIYYSQVWSVVWEDDVLFPNPIEAWKNGPVVRDLWEATRGSFRVSRIPNAEPNKLTIPQIETVEKVLNFYGDKDAQWLSDLTHMEAPWKEAFATAQNAEISLERVSEYYSTIDPNEQERSSN